MSTWLGYSAQLSGQTLDRCCDGGPLEVWLTTSSWLLRSGWAPSNQLKALWAQTEGSERRNSAWRLSHRNPARVCSQLAALWILDSSPYNRVSQVLKINLSLSRNIYIHILHISVVFLEHPNYWDACNFTCQREFLLIFFHSSSLFSMYLWHMCVWPYTYVCIYTHMK